MNNMKAKRIVMAVLTAAMALPATPMASQFNDRALFTASARGGSVDKAPVVRAGTALIDEALMRVIPVPYRIMLDESVPASMYLVWGNGDNWMAVLTRALLPVGLVAKPDWSKNIIKIERKIIPAHNSRIAAASTAPVVIAPAPAAVVPVVSPATDVPDQNGNLVQPQRTNGSFVVVKPEPKVPAPNPVSPVAQDSHAVLAHFTAYGHGQIPAPDVMWQLMKAAVKGDRIVLEGFSSVSDEQRRARYAGIYARKLRDNMLAVGFPARAVVIEERGAVRANKPGVRIVIIKGGL